MNRKQGWPGRALGEAGARIGNVLTAARRKGGSLRDLRRTLVHAGIVLQEGGPAELLATIRRVVARNSSSGPISHDRWLERFGQRIDGSPAEWRARDAALPERPLVSILLPLGVGARLSAVTLQSLGAQVYDAFELIVARDDALPADPPELAGIPHHVVTCTGGPRTADLLNLALAKAGGPYVLRLEPDVALRPHALLEFVEAAAARPHCVLFYADEDVLDGDGARRDPFFKPDIAPDLLRGMDFIGPVVMLDRQAVLAAGGWQPGFEGAADHDLALRLLESPGAAGFAHIPRLLVQRPAGPRPPALADPAAAGRAVAAHLARIGSAGRCEALAGTGYRRIVYPVPQPAPLVSLIIPTRDRADLLETCIGSIRSRTAWREYEIIVVDNGSSEPEALALLARLRGQAGMLVLDRPGPFNYSALNNEAVRHARGQVIGLVNNDIEVITPGWLEEMLSLAMRPEIGCVGALLYYPDDTIQHAGVVLGLGVAGHGHKGLARGQGGYFDRLRVVGEVSAVTAACLLVRREVFEAVGGLNEDALKIALNDVDFCLKVAQAGYRNLFTPFAELYHHESVSRGKEDDAGKLRRFRGEVRYMQERWRAVIANDPFYSPNLTRDREDFSPGNPPGASLLRWKG